MIILLLFLHHNFIYINWKNLSHVLWWIFSFVLQIRHHYLQIFSVTPSSTSPNDCRFSTSNAMFMLMFMFVTIIAINHVETKISSDCPLPCFRASSMFRVRVCAVSLSSNFPLLPVRHDATQSSDTYANQCISLSIWMHFKSSHISYTQ